MPSQVTKQASLGFLLRHFGEADGGFYMLGLGKHVDQADILNSISFEAFQVTGQGGWIARNINDLLWLGTF